ncbi:MAG: hypothetical protein U0521_07435 [Anaerolineae bacterium]
MNRKPPRYIRKKTPKPTAPPISASAQARAVAGRHRVDQSDDARRDDDHEQDQAVFEVDHRDQREDRHVDQPEDELERRHARVVAGGEDRQDHESGGEQFGRRVAPAQL